MKANESSDDDDEFASTFLMYYTIGHLQETSRHQAAKTMMAPAEKVMRFPFRIAFELPFIKFHIGTGETPADKAQMLMLFDTGGCCMMMNLDYGREMHKETHNLDARSLRRKEGKEQEVENEEEENNENERWNPRTTDSSWTRRTEPTLKSAVIMDDIILVAISATTLLFSFLCVLSILKHHRVTVNIRKSRFLPKRAEFVGVDVLPGGNSPAQSKNKAVKDIQRLILFTDLRLLIGLLGFYRNWIPLYETRIAPWRKILKQQPVTGQLSKEEDTSPLEPLFLLTSSNCHPLHPCILKKSQKWIGLSLPS